MGISVCPGSIPRVHPASLIAVAGGNTGIKVENILMTPDSTSMCEAGIKSQKQCFPRFLVWANKMILRGNKRTNPDIHRGEKIGEPAGRGDKLLLIPEPVDPFHNVSKRIR
jgi:hypothetical protein